MKILFLSPVAGLGGAERCLLDMAASIRAHCPACDLGIVVGGNGPLAGEAERIGMRVVTLRLGDTLAQVGDSAIIAHGPVALGGLMERGTRAAIEGIEYVGALRRVIREFAPSFVHSNGIKMHLLAAAARSSAPLIWHIHDFIGDRPLASRALGACAWRADAAIANSNAVAEDARGILPRVPLTVVHNAIDTDAFSPSGEVADLDLLADSQRTAPHIVRIGLVATYARWKGHDVFLQSGRILKAVPDLPEFRFYIVGGPIYETTSSQYSQQELRALARQLEVAHFTTFVPFQPRIEPVYRALDVVVHASSRREPFGRTIVEAMATGKPVIVTAGGGASELFVDGVDALAVPPRDAQALAKTLGELIADPHRRHVLGGEARASAVRRFSRERLATQVLAAYQRRSGPSPLAGTTS